MNHQQVAALRDRLEQFLAQILFSACSRSQQGHWGSVYVRGLVLDGERKSVGAMAESMPDGNEQAMQQFVSQSTWPFEPVRKRLAQFMEPLLPGEGVWIVDKTGFPKKGEHSVGVARQYCGTLGKVGNCQVAVSLHYATPAGSLPLNFRLYLPEEWVNDLEGCRKVGIPEDQIQYKYKPKWQIALDLIDEARRWQLVDQVVNADAACGRVTGFREGLRNRGLQYLVAVDSDHIGCWLGEVPATPRTYRGPGRPPTRFHCGDHRPLSTLQVARSLPQEGRSPGTRAPRDPCAPVSPRFGSIRPTATGRGCHRGRKSGCLSNGLRGNPSRRTTGSRTYRPLPLSSAWFVGARCAGTSNRTTSSSKKSSGWITSRVEPGLDGIDT